MGLLPPKKVNPVPEGSLTTPVDTSVVDDKLLQLSDIGDVINATLKNPLDGVLLTVSKINDQIGPSGLFTALNNLDHEASKLVKTFGISKQRAGELTQTVADAIPKFVGMGLKVGDVAETLQGLGETMNVNIMLNADSLASFAATAEVTKVKQSELAEKFRDVGVSIASIEPKMLDVVKIARQAGVTVQAVSAGVVTNLDKMNLYNFEGGIKGLAKMSAQASRLGVDMSKIFSVAATVFNPEGAIEFAKWLKVIRDE